MKLSKKVKISMLEQMLLTRYFEEKVDELFAKGLIHGTAHLSIGEEAMAAGPVNVLQADDLMAITHRGHGTCIAKGADINIMMAELMGKETGYCKGKGGSIHVANLEEGNLGANGIVGGGIPIATGAALAQKMQNTGKIVLCFFGDGASNEGTFHESLNMASIWQLPIVYVCVNNMYGMSTCIEDVCPTNNISDRASAYQMEGITVDGNDVLEMFEVTNNAVIKARKGQGPTLIEGLTYRWKGHSKSDANLYRTREEIEEWKKKCPIKRFKVYLIEQKIMSEEEIKNIETSSLETIERAVEFAEQSPSPSLDALEEDLYAS
ncbi:MAG: thiamine pyrophosphate-dependent dehydrogenase E1 component subunit alpha [Bacillota bacterium]